MYITKATEQTLKFFFFCLILGMSYVNFDVFSIAFKMYLINGVLFSVFVLIRDYCTPITLDQFPHATTLLSLSYEFDIKSEDAVIF